MQLIKFLTNNNDLINSLKDCELYFNSVVNFNDPFEGTFRFKLWSDTEKIKDFYLKHYSGDPKKLNFYLRNKGELEKEINKNFDYRELNNAVTCFSAIQNLNNILMWANYANNHAGVCLIFDTNILKFRAGRKLHEEELKERKMFTSPTGPHKIAYVSEYINSDPLEGKLNQKTFLTTKFDIWKKEKEFRYIAPKIGLYYFPPEALIQVVFGLRTPPNQKTQIKNIVAKVYPLIIFKRIKLKEEEFAFEIEPEMFDG